MRASKIVHVNAKIKANVKNPKKLGIFLKKLLLGKLIRYKLIKLLLMGKSSVSKTKWQRSLTTSLPKLVKMCADSVKPIRRHPTDYIPESNPHY